MNLQENPQSSKTNKVLLKLVDDLAYDLISRNYDPVEAHKDWRKRTAQKIQAYYIGLLPEKIDNTTALWSAQKRQPLTYNKAIDDMLNKIREKK